MVNNIIDGISKTLQNKMGDKYHIYADESINQGFMEPCFFISLVHYSQSRVVGERYKRICQFDILYFPKKRNGYSEAQKMGEKLFYILKMVSLPNGDLIQGTNMYFQIIDGVLHFFINYNSYMYSEFEKELMKDLILAPSTKGEFNGQTSSRNY